MGNLLNCENCIHDEVGNSSDILKRADKKAGKGNQKLEPMSNFEEDEVKSTSGTMK